MAGAAEMETGQTPGCETLPGPSLSRSAKARSLFGEWLLNNPCYHPPTPSCEAPGRTGVSTTGTVAALANGCCPGGGGGGAAHTLGGVSEAPTTA